MVGGTAGKLFLPTSSGSRIRRFLGEVRRLVGDRYPSFDGEAPPRRRPTGKSGGRRNLRPQLKPPEERVVEVVTRNRDGIERKDVVDATR